MQKDSPFFLFLLFSFLSNHLLAILEDDIGPYSDGIVPRHLLSLANGRRDFDSLTFSNQSANQRQLEIGVAKENSWMKFGDQHL